MPPAKTGREAKRRKAVTIILQTKSDTLSKLTSDPRKFQKVVIKFTLLKIDPRPAK
jgi:hypothetical protein